MSLTRIWMDLEIITVSKSHKDKYHMVSLRRNLKNDTKELIYKTEIDLQTQKTTLWLPKRKGGKE